MRHKLKLSWNLQVGDIVFILMGTPLFRKVAKDTGSWTNHVGIVVDVSGEKPIVAESKFPFSTLTPLSKFVARSVGGRAEVKRFGDVFTPEESRRIKQAAEKRLGIFYDAGFNLHSKRQFCSRFAHEVMREATGREVGQVETLAALFARNPNATLAFWRMWYLGRIPWNRATITPASMIEDAALHTIIHGERGHYSVALPQAGTPDMNSLP